MASGKEDANCCAYMCMLCWTHPLSLSWNGLVNLDACLVCLPKLEAALDECSGWQDRCQFSKINKECLVLEAWASGLSGKPGPNKID
jgi:hypothetical protein